MAQRLGREYGAGGEREKASKMAEIENYVGILIENNKGYAEELHLLRKENTDLRGQLEVLMGDMLRGKEGFEDVLAQTKAGYAAEVGGLIEELKDILRGKEQMEGSYRALLEELSLQSANDRSAHAAQLADLERNYDSKLRILNDRIQDQNRELEANFYLASDSKLKMVKEIDALRFEAGELRKQNTDLLQGQAYLEEEAGRLSAALKALAREKEEVGVSLLKVEQEKNHAIIELRQGTALLRDQLNDQLDNLKRMEAALQAKEKEYLLLADRHHHEERQRKDADNHHQTAALHLAEREAELSALRAELGRQGDSSAREAKRMTELIKMLEAENARAVRERDELQAQNLEKQQEIFTLLERVQKLERECESSSGQLAQLGEEASSLACANERLTEELDIALLSQRRDAERCQLQANHIATLEQLLEKERKRAYLDSVSDREAAHSRQLALGSDLALRYESQLAGALREKSEMAGVFEAEKERLVRTYENALREKEQIFKDKIRFLETEVLELSKLA